MEKENPKVRVGIGVCVFNTKNEVLLGKRKNAHGEGSWAFPGGHLEFGESWEECAIREVAEETSVTIKDISFGAITNDIFTKENKHYVTIFLTAKLNNGLVKTMEPHKCEEWKWFKWESIPKKTFLPLQNLIKQGITLKP